MQALLASLREAGVEWALCGGPGQVRMAQKAGLRICGDYGLNVLNSYALREYREAGAEELERQLMSRLSGGQRQRVYLAMLLAQDTRNVLLDEPTTYLDVAHQFRLLNCARRLADQGRAVVLVLHDLCLSLLWADQLAVLDSGRLQMADSPERVFTSGILDRVFEVNVRRFQTPNGWQYYCEGKTPPSPQ